MLGKKNSLRGQFSLRPKEVLRNEFGFLLVIVMTYALYTLTLRR